MENIEEKESNGSGADLTYKPYDVHGKKYVEAQRSFYKEDFVDFSRVFIREKLEGQLEGKTVLDLGCGAGDDLVTYAELGAARVVGVEPSETMRTLARETLASVEKDNLPIELIEGEIENIPLADASVDVVVCRFSLHILSKLDTAFKEIARVLQPGRTLLIAVGHPEHDAAALRAQGKEMGDRIELNLFGRTTPVSNGSHTMDEYVGEVPSRYFEVIETHGQYTKGEGVEDVPTELHVVYKRKRR